LETISTKSINFHPHSPYDTISTKKLINFPPHSPHN
jgi:hypothetical protein